MERLEGQSLQARLARGRLSNEELLRIARLLAAAIASIHQVGLVHQDIKPSNVFLTRTGGVKVLDFGIATWAGAPSEGGSPASAKTRRPVLGSPNYISPERLLHRPADTRSDLFSLGIVLYEMATGRPPFDSYSPIEMLLNVVDARTIPLLRLAPDRPPALARIVHTLLGRRAEDRYQSATAVLKALRAIRVPGGTSVALAS
jgi:serine/threonine protein kinase